MAEAAVLEKQDIGTVRINSKSTFQTRPSLGMRLSKHNIREMDFVEGAVELVDSSELESLGRGIGEFYAIPPERIKKTLKSIEMWVLKDEMFNKIKEADIRKAILEIQENNSMPEEDKKRQIDYLQFQKEHMEGYGGSTYSSSRFKIRKFFGKINFNYFNKQEEIIIKENYSLSRKHVKIHEFMHALVDYGHASGLKTINGEFGNINEAAAEILTLAYIHRDLSTSELLSKIYAGEIGMAYEDGVKALLTLMYVATPDEKHFTINDLADYYFQRAPNKNSHTLIWDIVSRVKGEDLKKSVRGLLCNDLCAKQPQAN
jgi:hypothetical protein